MRYELINDRHLGWVLYCPEEHAAYRIPASYYQTFRILCNRHILAIAAFILLSILMQIKIIYALPLSIAIFIILEYRFRKMIGSCSYIKPYASRQTETDRPLLHMTAYFALAICLGVNCYIKGYSGFELIINLLLILIVVYLGFRYTK